MYSNFAILPSETHFKRTIIKSKYALSYGQAQNILDNRSLPASTAARPGVCGGFVDDDDIEWLRNDLELLRDAARVFLTARKARNAVSLSSTDIKFSMDSNTGAAQGGAKPHLEVHSTIEEWMLAANKAAEQ